MRMAEPMTALPPRPDLSGFMMGVGFMLTPTRFLDACQKRCGDYFTLRPGEDRIMVITSDPAAVRQVFSGDPNLLYAGEGNIALAPILGSASVLLLDGDQHMRQRKLLLPPFHGERMRDYGELMEEAAARHIAAWPRGRRFGVLESMQSITLEIIMRAVFGFDDAERRERIGAPLRRLLDTLGSRARVAMMAVTLGRNGPLSPWRRFVALREEADELIYAEIAARRADPHGAEGDDIFSMLLAARDADGRPLSDTELRDELMTLLVAGHETTATALAWALELLGRHPDVLAKLLADERSGGGGLPRCRDQGDAAAATGRARGRPAAAGADDDRTMGSPRRRPHRTVDLSHAPPRRHLPGAARLPARTVPRR